MIELNTWAGLEPAVMDIKTVSGLAQVFELTLTDSVGSVVELDGVTFRGAVNTAPLREFACSMDGGRVLFGWAGLPAGRHSFDLYMVTGNVERALLRGAMVVSGRTMPPLKHESYSVNNAATLVLPDTVDGTILIELSEVGLVDLLSRRAGAFAEEGKEHLRSIRELKEWIEGKVDGFDDVVVQATTAITEAGTVAAGAVEAGRTEAVKAVSSEKEGALALVKEAGETAGRVITEAGRDAVKSVTEGRDGAAEAISTGKEDALTAVKGAENTAVTVLRKKQSDAVLAVGRAQKTATDNVASVQGTAVTAVETAQMEAVAAVQTARTEAIEKITPLVDQAETAKEAIDQAEVRVNTAVNNAGQSAQTASDAATAAQEALAAMPQVDTDGNMTLGGNITAESATVHGQLVVNNPGGSIGAGTHNQVYGTTWFYGGVEFREGAIIRGNTFVESGILNINKAASLNCNGPATYNATINANGGVRVPLPATAQEALSYEALIEQRAADDWRRMGYYMDTLIPSWVTTIVRQIQMAAAHNVGTANVSITEGVCSNDWQDMLVTITPAPGVSLIGRSTVAWKFANYLGNSNNRDYAAAAIWRIIGSDQVSIILGSTSHGYATTTNPAAACYSHPIHWADYNLDAADYRYPLLNAVNNYTSRDMAPAWQVTIYPTGYLGSTASCLIRGTDYGRDVGDQLYMWALVPKITYLAVAMAPRAAVDHQNVMNRWELFVDGNYVMPMTSLFCGSGHTACVTVKAKAHAVSSTYQVGMRMGGMRIDATPALGVTNVWSIMERVVMDGATVKPVPAVEASSLEAPAAGGNITLTASSTLAEAMYVINDTMCGHDSAAVWCSQSTEQIPAGGGEVTLTLAPNTTGQPRQVWAFVGHHYAQAAVIKINQLAQ